MVQGKRMLSLGWDLVVGEGDLRSPAPAALTLSIIIARDSPSKMHDDTLHNLITTKQVVVHPGFLHNYKLN